MAAWNLVELSKQAGPFYRHLIWCERRTQRRTDTITRFRLTGQLFSVVEDGLRTDHAALNGFVAEMLRIGRPLSSSRSSEPRNV